jgi:maleate cis-trans isomerase
MIADIEAQVACPVISTSQSMVDAFCALSLRRVAVLTPYLDAINEAESRFIEAQGFEVAAIHGMGLSGAQIREVPPQEILAVTMSGLADDADALFISCTDFRSLEIVPVLEQALKKPVLTSNQVTLWGILRACRYKRPVPRLGSYLTIRQDEHRP